MIWFFHRELVVGINVHGQVVLVTLNAQIELVKKDAFPLERMQIRHTFLKRRCCHDVEKCAKCDFSVLTLQTTIQNFRLYLTFWIWNESYFSRKSAQSCTSGNNNRLNLWLHVSLSTSHILHTADAPESSALVLISCLSVFITLLPSYARQFIFCYFHARYGTSI